MGPFMMPNMPYQMTMPANLSRGLASPMMGAMPRSGGLRSLLGLGGGRGLFSGLRGINWSNMLGNTSRALGVVKEAIPIVKEVGPMMNNMKSMLKIASVFKDETDTKKDTHKVNRPSTQPETKAKTEKKEDAIQNETSYQETKTDNKPNFFL